MTDGRSARLTFIAALIVDNPLCLECIALKTDLRLVTTEAWLAIVARTVALERAPGECRCCGRPQDVVFSISIT